MKRKKKAKQTTEEQVVAGWDRHKKILAEQIRDDLRLGTGLPNRRLKPPRRPLNFRPQMVPEAKSRAGLLEREALAYRAKMLKQIK